MRGLEASMVGAEAQEAEQVQEARRFRVRVCLQRLFSDERARCYVWVSGARRVRWLVQRLRRLFELPPAPTLVLALVSRGHLLPPAEPLAVLAPDDPVEVIPIREDHHTHEQNDAYELESDARDELDSVSEPTPAKRPRPAVAHTDTTTNPDPDHLLEVKRRALRLLEHVTCASPPAPPTPTSVQTRPRRRRVRRRRAPRPYTEDQDRRDTRDTCDTGDSRECRVSRNEGAAARSPRAVHSLKSLEPPADAVR